MKKRFFLFLLALILSNRATAQTPVPTPDYARVRKDLASFIPQEMRKHNVKGLSIALVDGDQVVWCEGFGTSDEKVKTPATGDTLYRIGALSKLFTASEILRLSEKKALKLDSPLSKYIPGFSIRSRFQGAPAPTLRSLLAQHSGLPAFYIRGMWADPPIELSQLVEDLKSDYRVAPTGTFYRYSYVDYDLLGRVVELRDKKSFPDALRENLLQPLGMESSFFGENPELEEKLSKAYKDGKESPTPRLRDIPAGGMVSSARDLSRFLQFVFNPGSTVEKAPLSPKIVESMFEPQYPDLAMDFGHQVGLGWTLSGLSIPGSEKTAWSAGAYPPYVSWLAVLPREKLGVVLLANTAEAQELGEDVTIRALKGLAQAKTGVKQNLEKEKITMPKVVPVSEEKLESYSGFYSALGQVCRIFRNESHLSISMSRGQLDLMPVAENRFIPRIVLLLLFPIDLPQFPLEFLSPDGKEVAVLRGLPFPIPVEKITPVEISPAWKERQGEYEADDPEGKTQFKNVSLGEKDGLLTVSIRVTLNAFNIKDQEFKVAILPVSDQDAVVTGLFYGDGGTLHTVEEKGRTRIFYSGYVFTKKEAENK